MAWSPEKVTEIAALLRAGETPPTSTTRELLSWFGSERRGQIVVAMIRKHLDDASLRTEPDFEYTYLDGGIKFLLLEQDTSVAESAIPADVSEALLTGAGLGDPTYRIGKLKSANTVPTGVSPTASVAEAVTTMLYRDFSQLPIMQSERNLKGMVSWKSIGRSLALGTPCATVLNCAEEATVIGSDTSLFAAIPAIVEKEYVLIKDATARIVGIVTTTDLSLQFRQLAEPFLLLGEIENHLRKLSDGKFKPSDVTDVKDPADKDRVITNLADLTFGEHVRLLERPHRWAALALKVDRAVFIRHLTELREIRNNVMHFDPDGVEPEDLQRLRNFTRLLASLPQSAAVSESGGPNSVGVRHDN